MCITIRHELRHAMKAWPGTLVDPCLLSEYTSTTYPILLYDTLCFLYKLPHLEVGRTSRDLCIFLPSNLFDGLGRGEGGGVAD
jgi:hypothetical protein